MKRISLSSILLFSLSIFFIMQYRLSPGTTPYWLFGSIFLLLTVYILLDVLTLSQKIYDRLKIILLSLITILVLGSAFSASMIVRHESAPVYGVNDIILQQEAAIRFLLHGKNPWSATYFNTPMASFNYSATEVNPALYHFVMEPLYLVIPLPFYVLSNHTIGYFDAREVLWLLLGVLLLLAYFVPEEQENKRILITLLAFNPAMLGYILEGRSDIFVYTFLFAGLLLLQNRKLFWAGILTGIAFAIKQSVWPFIPLYIVYLFHIAYLEKNRILDASLLTLKNVSGFLVVVLASILPFFFWNPSAFFASTISFLSGTTPHSYPISGYGFGMVLNSMGIIKNVNAYFPFTYFQLGIGLPVLCLLIWYLWKTSSIQRLILFYALFLFVFWYFARYFNNSHVGYLSMVFITAYLWPKGKKVSQKI